mmetsp:Transcript_31528/g.88522  ORF Transcript_31528/g.88522 Transcript_31528/m.88522 type:complete len:146 (+) Transcript_31528:101-538(+)
MDANMTSQTNSEREQRLRELISEFRTAATDGIRVELVDKESQLVCQGIFKLDSAQMTMSLQPAFLPETSWSMREIGAVMKGKEFARCVPELAHLSAKCIGIDFDTETQIRCLHFDDKKVRDDFYACLKILRTCAGSVHSGTVAGG